MLLSRERAGGQPVSCVAAVLTSGLFLPLPLAWCLLPEGRPRFAAVDIPLLILASTQ